MATLESQILHFITESSTKVTYTSLARHFRRARILFQIVRPREIIQRHTVFGLLLHD